VLRRVELIAQGSHDVVLVGSRYCAATLRIREFLSRNDHPFSELDLDQEADVQGLLDHFHITMADVPVVICRCRTVLKNPSNGQLADCLGFNESIDVAKSRDLVIVGGGPSGIGAAVYGASEGLDVLVLEATAPGGQAGSSSRIENYLGFPTGISGQELAGRAYTQAQKFGAQILIAGEAAELTCNRKPYSIRTDSGAVVSARTVVIATGAQYRKPSVQDLSRFEGAGVYYAATGMEAQLCAGEEIIIVGGGNSAGQAAVFLAESCRHVHVLVRSAGLSGTKSRDLIPRVRGKPHLSPPAPPQITALHRKENPSPR